jgi:hypothetical protein
MKIAFRVIFNFKMAANIGSLVSENLVGQAHREKKNRKNNNNNNNNKKRCKNNKFPNFVWELNN